MPTTVDLVDVRDSFKGVTILTDTQWGTLAKSKRTNVEVYSVGAALYGFRKCSVDFLDVSGNRLLRGTVCPISGRISTRGALGMSRMASEHNGLWFTEDGRYIGFGAEEILSNFPEVKSSELSLVMHPRLTATISVDPNGGEDYPDVVVQRGSVESIPDPIRTGWDFQTWVDSDGSTVRFPLVVLSDLHLKAKFVPRIGSLEVKNGVIFSSSNRKSINKLSVGGRWVDIPAPSVVLAGRTYRSSQRCFYFFCDTIKYNDPSKPVYKLEDGYILFIYPVSTTEFNILVYNVADNSVVDSVSTGTNYYLGISNTFSVSTSPCIAAYTSGPISWGLWLVKNPYANFASSGNYVTVSTSTYPNVFVKSGVDKVFVMRLKDYFNFSGFSVSSEVYSSAARDGTSGFGSNVPVDWDNCPYLNA